MPVTSPSGGYQTFTLEAGEKLTVSGGAGAAGRVIVLGSVGDEAGSILETANVGPSQTVTRGPYAFLRNIRVYATAGLLQVGTSRSLSPLTATGPTAVMSADGTTLTGAGVKPNSSVVVLDQDTGSTIGSALADDEGDWVLVATFEPGQRVTYEAVVIGPYVVVPGAGDMSSSLDLTQPIGPGSIPVV